MWRTINSVSKTYSLHRVTVAQVAARGSFGEAARKDGATWLIDDEHHDFKSWLDAHWQQPRVAGSSRYIIKAAGPGPAWAEIMRVGSSMSDPLDPRNHMLLSSEQEQAYQQALQLVKRNRKRAAFDVLKPVFEKVWIESEIGP